MIVRRALHRMQVAESQSYLFKVCYAFFSTMLLGYNEGIVTGDYDQIIFTIEKG